MGTHGSLAIFYYFYLFNLFILTIFIGLELLYTVVLVSAVQQYESVTCVCVCVYIYIYIYIYTHTSSFLDFFPI